MIGTITDSEVGPEVYCLHTTPSLIRSYGDLVVVETKLVHGEERWNNVKEHHTTGKSLGLGSGGALDPLWIDN